MPKDSDRHLVFQTLRGETEAYGKLVQRYQQSVFNVCYRMLGEQQQAEDLAQDTFIRAHRRLGTFDVGRPFGPWIRRIAANLCLNQLKRERPSDQSLDDELTPGAPAISTNPEKAVEGLERNRAIRQALLELPPHYRAVIELRHYQELNYQEIADTLEIPLNTAKSHLYRARKLLAGKLENIYEYT